MRSARLCSEPLRDDSANRCDTMQQTRTRRCSESLRDDAMRAVHMHVRFMTVCVDNM